MHLARRHTCSGSPARPNASSASCRLATRTGRRSDGKRVPSKKPCWPAGHRRKARFAWSVCEVVPNFDAALSIPPTLVWMCGAWRPQLQRHLLVSRSASLQRRRPSRRSVAMLDTAPVDSTSGGGCDAVKRADRAQCNQTQWACRIASTSEWQWTPIKPLTRSMTHPQSPARAAGPARTTACSPGGPTCAPRRPRPPAAAAQTR